MNTETNTARRTAITFTPGEWQYRDGGVHSPIYGRLLLADRENTQTAPWERDRNVQLAAAAPELLDALKRALWMLEENGVVDFINKTPDAAVHQGRHLAIIRNTIAKATGA